LNRLFVGNLHKSISETDLKNFFKDLDIKTIDIKKDSLGITRGFAFIEFTNEDSLKKAIALNKTAL
jgi:RNA-binding protein 39